ncbi:peptidase M27 [Salmonella phage 41]|nr:peptidase M27 [Salmonella phage 41]
MDGSFLISYQSDKRHDVRTCLITILGVYGGYVPRDDLYTP